MVQAVDGHDGDACRENGVNDRSGACTFSQEYFADKVFLKMV